MNLRNPSPTKEEKHHTLRTILLCENMILTNIPTSPPSHNQHPPTFPRSGQHQISLPILDFWGRTIEIVAFSLGIPQLYHQNILYAAIILPPHCRAIASAIPGKVLLLSFLLSSGDTPKKNISVNHLGDLFPLFET